MRLHLSFATVVFIAGLGRPVVSSRGSSRQATRHLLDRCRRRSGDADRYLRRRINPVDTGNPGRRDPDRIIKMAAEAGLKQIDHLVITHYHRDHFGGAAALAQSMPVRTVYDNGLFEGIREKPDKEYLEFQAGRRVVLSPGDEVR